MGTGGLTPHRAVFLDRDGVLNDNIRNPLTGALEAPLIPAQLRLIPGVITALAELRDADFMLILVSNQPDLAKGKSNLVTLAAIHHKLEEALSDARVTFAEFNYCFHDPDGVVPAYSRVCRCRKPSPYFLLRARGKFALEMRKCWMVGDRLTDVECGLAAGVKTILIKAADNERIFAREPPADYVVTSLKGAVKVMIRRTNP